MATSTTLYSPLDDTLSQIRLLEINTRRSSDFVPFSCRLRTVSLDDAPDFFALSYVWGDPKKRKDVTINGITMSVTANLESALRHVRRKGHGVTEIKIFVEPSVPEPRSRPESSKPGPDLLYLWADAICINQEDIPERESQVQLMRRIYSSANTVIAWLGHKDYDNVFKAYEAFSLEVWRCRLSGQEELGSFEWMNDLELFRDPPDADRSNIKDAAVWDEIGTFLRDPYWSRIWILQEVALAGRLVLATRDTTFAWITVSRISTLLLSRTQHKWKSLSRTPRIPESSLMPLMVEGYMPWIAIVGPTGVQESLASAASAVMGPPHGGWHLALRLATGYAATDPRDHIYGLLGVTGIEIKPDYSSAKATDVYRDFVVGFLEASRGMPRSRQGHPFKFLTAAGIGRHEYEADMPTWVPNFPKEQEQPSILVPPTCYSADKGVFAERDEYATITGNSLFVTGLAVDIIDCLSITPDEEVEQDKMYVLSVIRAYLSRRKEYVTCMPPLEAFFRLLYRDPSRDVSEIILKTAFSFFRFLLSCGEKGILAPLFCLGYPVDWEGHYTVTEAVEALRHEDLERWWLESFFPGVSLAEFGLEGMFKSWWEGEKMSEDMEGPMLQVLGEMTVLNDFRIFETPMGFLGLAPKGTKKGDEIYVLKDCGFPVILRKVESHFLYVGPAFVLGIMDGETRFLVEDGLVASEVLEIR